MYTAIKHATTIYIIGVKAAVACLSAKICLYATFGNQLYKIFEGLISVTAKSNMYHAISEAANVPTVFIKRAFINTVMDSGIIDPHTIEMKVENRVIRS